jgi:hypothetical protein
MVWCSSILEYPKYSNMRNLIKWDPLCTTISVGIWNLHSSEFGTKHSIINLQLGMKAMVWINVYNRINLTLLLYINHMKN